MKIANNFIMQFANLNGCECNAMCKDYNQFATKKYAPGIPGITEVKGEFKKTDLFDFKNKKVKDYVCDSMGYHNDIKYGFICFNPAKRPNDSSWAGEPGAGKKFLDKDQYGKMQELIVNVLWSEMTKAAGDEYKSDTGIMTFAGYKKWRESALYDKEIVWTDKEVEALICNIEEFQAKQLVLKEDQIRAKLKGEKPFFGNKTCK